MNKRKTLIFILEALDAYWREHSGGLHERKDTERIEAIEEARRELRSFVHDPDLEMGIEQKNSSPEEDGA
jgi:hypothetical protein